MCPDGDSGATAESKGGRLCVLLDPQGRGEVGLGLTVVGVPGGDDEDVYAASDMTSEFLDLAFPLI